MKLWRSITMILVATLALNLLTASEIDPKELAKDWETLVTKMMIEKYKVKVQIGEKEYRVIDVKAQNSILLITVDKDTKIAVSLPFVTKDRNNVATDLYFTFTK